MKQYDYFICSFKNKCVFKVIERNKSFVLKMLGRKQDGNFDVYKTPSALNSDKKKQRKIYVKETREKI